ncbi:MAG: esterase family protein [Bacteroidales bacterium]|nr:esterase family protein [Bacteroidales bacterium]
MKKIVLALAAALAALPLWAGKVVTDSLYSSVLGAAVKYNVYLPDGYGKTAREYPVVYLLHGLSDDYTAWAGRGGVQLVADELIRSGEAVPMVIVMPNAGGADIHNTWNGYFNMPGWNYEDFFFSELIPSVEKKYSCGGSKGSRAIMGLSMGGGGSTVYAQRHPDMFSSCYAMSAWLDNKTNEVSDGKERKDKFWYVCEAVKEHSALEFLDNADKETLKKLRTVAWFLDCGDDDFLLQQSMDFHMKMRKAKVHSEFRVRDGVHNWEYWHLALRWSLPFASRNFE